MNQPVEVLSQILERISDAVFALDKDWKFIYVNTRAGEIFKQPASQLLGKRIWSEVPTSKDQPFFKACYRAMEEQVAITLEEYHPDRDCWFQKSIYPSPEGLSVIIKEIADRKLSNDEILETQLKEAKEEIKKSTERFSLVARATNDMIWDWNLATDELWWNYNYNNLFGHDPQLAYHDIGSWVKSIHPDDMQRVEDGIYGVIKSGEKFWSDEYRYLKADGTVLNIYDRGYVVYDDKGKPCRMIGSMLNITDRLEAEHSLKESEEKYRTLVEQASDAIFIVDDTGRFYTVNDSACRMTQYSEAELLKMTIYDFSIKEDIEKNPYRFGELKMGHTVIVERTMSRKDGVVFNVEITAKVLLNGRILVFARDITERVKVNERLKESYEHIRNLASHLTHVREEERRRIGREIHDELGQQLTAVKMDIAWIDKKTGEESGQIKSKLKNIIGLLDGSNQSIRRILTELNPGIIDNHGLVEAMERQNRQFTTSTGLGVEFTTSESRIHLSQAIANCIFRVYQESLTNIMKYAQATKVMASLVIEKDQLITTIEDDGKGFDLAAIQNKKSFGILGMKERVFSQDGQFEIESKKGKGTRIVVTLPYGAVK